MAKSDLSYLKQLKFELQEKYKTIYKSCKLEITEWKQKEINNFQQLMEKKVNDRVSEKWFYTHIKNKNNTKLPRIDTLNLLCRFLEYDDWDDFITKNEKNSSLNKGFAQLIPNFTKNKQVRVVSLSLVILITMVLVFNNMDLLAQNKYSFCFVNSDSGEPLRAVDIEVLVLHKNQSAELVKCEEACFDYETAASEISFVVKADYYKTDTIVRIANSKSSSETIQLDPDDYALMIHIFSSSKIEDWQKRRKQLDKMIDDNAQIYQLDYSGNRGVEIYNKKEFINKMTMPINSLKNIKITENQYRNGRIFNDAFHSAKRGVNKNEDIQL